MAVDVVRSELLSNLNSLLNSKLTGDLSIFGP
jgi:hypothetical protein